MKTIFIILGILGFIFLFIMVLIMLGQLNDLCEYEKKFKKAKEFMNKYWVSYEDIGEHNKLFELDIPLEDIKELYEILGENKQ